MMLNKYWILTSTFHNNRLVNTSVDGFQPFAQIGIRELRASLKSFFKCDIFFFGSSRHKSSGKLWSKKISKSDSMGNWQTFSPPSPAECNEKLDSISAKWESTARQRLFVLHWSFRVHHLAHFLRVVCWQRKKFSTYKSHYIFIILVTSCRSRLTCNRWSQTL